MDLEDQVAVELGDEQLAAAADALKAPTLERVQRRVECLERIDPRRQRTVDLAAGHRRADEARGDLDLGQFGHGHTRVASRTTLATAMVATVAPDDIVRTHAEASANAREPLIVLEPLAEVLASAGLDAPDDLRATPIGEGHSNATFVLSTGVVLRRPPRGPLPPSAHDVLREARLLKALQATPVRVPRVLTVCDDPGVIGAPFYVMERVAGEVITDAIPGPLDNPEQRGQIAEELIDALVELHGIDWTRVGLEGFGKPSGYLERQLRRFNGLWEHNRTRELPQVETV